LAPAVIAAVVALACATAAGRPSAPFEAHLGVPLAGADRTPPHLRFRYDRHQDFLHTARIRIEVHSDSDALFAPECVLLTREAAWGLLYHYRHLRKGHWTRFACELEPGALRAAHIAARRGGHPRVAVHPIAYDKAGNRAESPKIYVFPR
jgi:hypothetical protein